MEKLPRKKKKKVKKLILQISKSIVNISYRASLASVEMEILVDSLTNHYQIQGLNNKK